MWVLPYRTLFQNEFERIGFGGERCYVTGEQQSNLLIYCPETAPPRNRIVSVDDPRIEREHIIENIFTVPPPEEARP